MIRISAAKTSKSIWINKAAISKVTNKYITLKFTARTMMSSSESMELELGSLSKADSLKLMKYLTPTLSYDNHKGNSGRIGVIGGCREYTGAPYFAAFSALRLGCDLAHVFCTSDAAPIIKSYSPELIVHPLLDAQAAVTNIIPWLPRLHSLVVGPGLGRDINLADTINKILEAAVTFKIPIVIDADGIFYIAQNPNVIRGQTHITLTPNAMEFERLYSSLIDKELPQDDLPLAVVDVCKSLDGVFIVRKGREDIISNGTHVLLCNNEGSPRRCGGQGDLLTGTAGIWQFWASNVNRPSETNLHFQKYGPQICGAYAACWLTRECNRLAYDKNKRSTLTTDMINEIGPIMKSYVDEC